MITRYSGTGGGMFVDVEALSRSHEEAIKEINRVDYFMMRYTHLREV